jgi:hypothetical protein
MFATYFGLFLGHNQACQYKTLVKEDVKIKAKQSRYRSGVIQRVPGI